MSPADRPAAGRTGFLRHLLGFAIGTLVVLIVLEVALRILGFVPSFGAPNELVGGLWKPGARYRWSVEGFSEGRINSRGWRDRDYSESKPPGTTRLLVLGDSYVQAMEVPLDSTFHKRLERMLTARALPDHRFEVIALGRGGFGTTEEYLTYTTWGRRYDPDVVVLMFILNDWADNWRWPGAGIPRPFFIDDGDSLRLDLSFAETSSFRRSRWTTAIKQRSVLLTFVADRFQTMRARIRPRAVEQGLEAERGWFQAWNVDRFPAADSIPAMQLTAKILGRLAGEVHRDGKRFVVAVGGIDLNLIPEFIEARAGDPNFDPDKTVRFLRETGRKYGFEVVSMVPEFRAWSAAGGPRPNWGSGHRYGHWNALGHDLAARVLFSRLAPGLEGLAAAAPDTGLAVVWTGPPGQ